MRPILFVSIALTIATYSHASEWRAEKIEAPARVTGIETVGGEARVNAGGLWYRIDIAGPKARLVSSDAPSSAQLPPDALVDGRVATGTRDIARAWLAEPTTRYDHGILGDNIEAGSLVIETRDGARHVLRLTSDAVFEDLEPRLADLDMDGHDEVVLVKTYLKRGSTIAIVSARDGKYDIVAETPPLGAPHRWLDPIGIADFNGDGKPDIALVRQPHVVGSLEIWTWQDQRLFKVMEIADAANHIAGTRAIHMAAVGDFDGDGIADIAVPSLDRSRLRIIGFSKGAHDIADIPLPSAVATNISLVKKASGPPDIAAGLADGSLVLIRRR